MERARLEDRSLLNDAATRTASIPKPAGRRVERLVHRLRGSKSSVAGQDRAGAGIVALEARADATQFYENVETPADEEQR